MAAGSTYTPISSTTLSTATGTVTFSSIPSTYTDLRLIVHQKNSQVGGTPFPGEDMWIRFNGDSSTNYSQTQIEANSGGIGVNRATNQVKIYIYSSSLSEYIPYSIDIQNYSNSTTFKSVLCEGRNTSNVFTSVGLWRSTSAITSITVTLNTSVNNFASGSTFTLYGIAAA